MKYKKISHEEFLNLKYNDEVFIKVADTMISKIVYKAPYYDKEKEKWILKTFTPRINYYEEEIYLKI